MLALTMTLTCAPLSALAASDNMLANNITVETSQSDAELMQAMVLDPFRHAVQAPAQQQEQTATVDTSNVSMTATNSFGRLLLDGMESSGEENGTEFSGANRVIDIEMDGSTATVKYIADETADLVVAVYTDSSAEEMVASGTVEVPATADNTGSSTVQVTVEGNIPAYYSVKAYLLDKAEHAPLSSVFTDNSKTEVISDIEEAEVSDFDPDRVVNLDDSVTTNFAVVAEGVIKVTEGEDDSSEAENSLARKGQFNIVQSADDENLVYSVVNPSNRLKYAREGQIVSVEYGEGDLFVTRIVRTELNGITLTIYGSRDFELGDAFDFLKLEEATGNGKEYQYVQGSSPAGVTWLGETTPQQYETNSIHVETSVTMQHKFEIGGDNPVTGTVAVGVAANFHFYYSSGTTDILFKTKGLLDGEVECKMPELEPPGIPLGEYTLAYKPGISMKVNPKLKFTADAKLKFKFSAETSAGFQWINGAVQTVDENPVFKFETELEGKVSLNIDLQPEVDVLHGVAKVELKAPLGVSVKFTRMIYSSEDQKIDKADWNNSPQYLHSCKTCFKTTSELGLALKVSVRLLEKDPWSDDITIPLSVGIPGHWSVDYNDFDLFGGDCQHRKYRVVITMDKADSANTVIYYRKSDGRVFEELGRLNAHGWLQVYLEPGTYTFSNVKDLAASDRYYGTLAITDSAQWIQLRYWIRTGECGADGGNLTWELTERGMLSIKGTGKMRDFTDENPAPWPVEGIKGLEIQNGVTSIGKNAFKGCDQMLSANISNTVREIGDYAFSDCSALKLLDISVGTEKIGKYAFNNCTNLESIKLPGGRTLAGGTLTRIEEGTFAGCEALTELRLPDCVTEIGSGAFSGCKALSSMELPDGVKSIPDEAFSGCSSLKKVSFADDLSGLGEKAFYSCTSLQVIAIPEGVQKISKRAFFKCRSLISITLPKSVTSIDDGAFASCRSVSKIELPETLESIGEYAFANCKALRGEETFTPSGSTKPLIDKCMTLPQTLQMIGDHAFEGCSNLDGIVFENGMVSIGNDVFRYCTSLSAAVLPDSLMYLGEGVFDGCTKLASIAIPHDVSQIGVRTFNGCTALKEVTLPGGTETIGAAAFNGCTVLERVNYNGLLEDWNKVEIGINNDPLYTAVIHCTDGNTSEISGTCGENLKWKLTEDGVLTISGTGAMFDYDLTDYNPWFKKYKDKVKNIVLEQGVTNIGEYAFYGCVSLQKITIPESVTSIGNSAFWECTTLRDVYYSGTQEQWKQLDIGLQNNEALLNADIHCSDGVIVGSEHGIWGDVYWRFTKDGTMTISGKGEITPDYSYRYPWGNLKKQITKVVIEEGITSVGTNAFSGAENLEEISLPEGLRSIGQNAFDRNSIQKLELPESLSSIGSSAFSSSKNLESVRIPSNVTKIAGDAFVYCPNLQEIWLPLSIQSIGERSAGDGDTCFSETVEIIHYGGTIDDWQKIRISGGNEKLKGSVILGADGPFTVRSGDCGTDGSDVQWTLDEDGTLVITGSGSIKGFEIPSYYFYSEESSPWPEDLVKRVVIGEGVTEIGKNAFYYNVNLEEAELPDSLTKIGDTAFGFCYKLQHISIPIGTTSIGKTAFRDTALTTLTLPEGLTTIRSGMFIDCKALGSIVIPSTVMSIEMQAFSSCDNLQDVYYLGTEEQWSKVDIGRYNDQLKAATIHYIIQSSQDIATLDDVIVLDETFLAPEMEPADESEPSDELHEGELPEAQEDAAEDEANLSESDEPEEDFKKGFEEGVKPDAESCDEMAELVDDATNAIIMGTTAQSDGTFHALFSGLTAGEEYAVILSRSAQQPLKAGTLVYINQLPADADGTLDVPFKADGAENLSYVVACRRGEELCTIEVTHGRSSDAAAASGKLVTITADDRAKEGYEFSKWAVLNGDVTLANASAAETTFVMGSRNVELEAIYSRDGNSIRVIDGTADKSTAEKDEKVTVTAEDRSSEGKTFQKWEVLAGGVTLANVRDASTTFVKGTKEVTVQAIYTASGANKPGTSGGSGGASGGGGAAGAAIGGAAVVVGLVTMLPVKVSGVAIRAEAVLPNATVQLVKDGAVVAQTVTDANGSFTLKAKRGTYQLNVTWQNAEGQTVTQSTAVTAPTENLTVRF